MKAISLWQPWATLIAIGAKRIETRSWYTNYRGPLAIHASKKWSYELARMCREPYFDPALGVKGYSNPDDLPRGCIVATCTLDDCCAIGDQLGGCIWLNGNRLPLPAYPERAFGDYTPGRWAWMLKNIRPLTEPIPAKGAQGFWEWDQHQQPAPEPSLFTSAGQIGGGK